MLLLRDSLVRLFCQQPDCTTVGVNHGWVMREVIIPAIKDTVTMKALAEISGEYDLLSTTHFVLTTFNYALRIDRRRFKHK